MLEWAARINEFLALKQWQSKCLTSIFNVSICLTASWWSCCSFSSSVSLDVASSRWSSNSVAISFSCIDTFIHSILEHTANATVARNLSTCTICKNVLHNFKIVHVQFANFWSKPDPNANTNLTQTLILTVAKLHNAFFKLCRSTNHMQH